MSGIDLNAFGAACLDAVRMLGGNAHYLIAAAHIETEIKNIDSLVAGSDATGPFQISKRAWTKYAIPLGFTDDDITFGELQPGPAAAVVVDAFGKLKAPEVLGALPTYSDVFFVEFFIVRDLDGTEKILAKERKRNSTEPSRSMLDALTEIMTPDNATDQQKADAKARAQKLIDDYHKFLRKDGKADGDILTVEGFVKVIDERIKPGFARAKTIIDTVEPGLFPEFTPAEGIAGKLRDVAIDEWTFFGNQLCNTTGGVTRAGRKENDQTALGPGGESPAKRVGKYWKVVGQNFDGTDTGQRWSGAFICFLVTEAGLKDKFMISGKHSHYISKSIKDFSDTNNNVAYWGRRLGDHKPAVGDIVCFANSGHGITYDNQNGGEYAGHCDLVVNVRANQIDVIGGNFGNSVSLRPLPRVLSIATGGDYRAANVAKNLVTSLNTFVAAFYFVAHGAVSWPPTLAMMAGCVIGGYFGGQFARVVPQEVMRVVVVVVGAALTAVFAWRYWF